MKISSENMSAERRRIPRLDRSDIAGEMTTRWGRVKANIEIADLAFICLRVVIFLGGIGWLFFTPLSEETDLNVSRVFTSFAVYSIALYLSLFFFPALKKKVYGFGLVLDLVFATVLIGVTGGFASTFFNGLYLITALYSFYYGLVPGILIASTASAAYFVGGGDELLNLHWTDFSVRIGFLFLLAIPLGMLSQKLKADKAKIEKLNVSQEKYIDELRTLQGELIQSEKLSALGRLTADVAHEIRNPLTSIGGFARRLEKKLHEGSREKGYAEIVVTEVGRLERILKDVLSFSREPKIEMEYQDLNGPVKDSIDAFSSICQDQSIAINEQLESSLSEVLIDRDQTRLAVNNLISNAIDVMPDGGKMTVKTYMARKYEIDYVVLEVSDTGPGLPAEALKKIFEPFYTTKEMGAGTGLGLSICKKIVDEHNGLIFAESENEIGTTFKMLFPFQERGNGSRLNCWEYHKCGVENAEGAANMRCPAYPDYGRVCWGVAGTFCGKKVSGAIAQKLGNCTKCDFYRHVAVQKDV